MQAVRSTAQYAIKVLGGQATALSGRDPVRFDARIRPPIMTAWSSNKLMQERRTGRRYGRADFYPIRNIFQDDIGFNRSVDTIRWIEGPG